MRGNRLAVAVGRPTVSVIIPAYNAERFLSETIESLAQQKYRDFETVVIDDGSTDKTASIAQSYSGVRYHYQPNRGPAAARNTGLKMSRGRYLAFLDSDDLWHKNMLSKCAAILDMRAQISAVHAKWLAIDEEGNVLAWQSTWKPWRGYIFERLLVEIPFNTSSLLWRRSCFEEVGGYDQTPEINDDWLNWLRIAYRGHVFESISDPLVFRRWHGASLARSQRYRVVRWRKRALDRLFTEVEVDQVLQKRAYARVYWIKSMVALADREMDEATSQFNLAVELREGILEQAETYFAIAFGGAGAYCIDKFDSRLAEANMRKFLTDLDAWFTGRQSKRRRRVWGEAYYYLAQMAYASADTCISQSRGFLWEAVSYYPGQLLSLERATWAARILLGHKLVMKARSIVQHSQRKMVEARDTEGPERRGNVV